MSKYGLINKIFEAGVSTTHSAYLNQKIILTNSIAILLAILSLSFCVLTYLYFSPLFIYPITFFIFGLLAVVCNYFGFPLLARFIVCGVFNTIYTLYHAHILPAHHHLIGSLFAIQMVFWLPPWLLFDFREKKWLFFYVSYYLLTSFSVSYLNSWLEIPLENFDMLKEGLLHNIAIGITALAISGGLLILTYLNNKSERHNQSLLEKIKAKNVELEQNQQQIQKQQAEMVAQNEELLQQQEEMRVLNENLEISANKLRSNETILKKAYEKLKQREKELEEKTKLLEEQQQEIIIQNEELQQQQEEIISVNDALESTLKKLKYTNDRMNKSIAYANKIQQVILPESSKLNAFFKAHFSLYLPKDIVSGDFYWFSQLTQNQAVFALADCTGHGVPGAFMSMIGNTLLHEIVNFNKIHSPALILQSLNAAIIKVLKQKEGKNTDGMDMGIALFQKQADGSMDITFAGARSNLYYFQQGHCYIIAGDRYGIGGSVERARIFHNQPFALQQGDMLYFTSDGFVDQNNAERKRFGSQAFAHLLAEIGKLDINEQKEKLAETLRKYQAKEEQRDDISVIGIKI
jgi:serine phosphatase RsbU (regulator of sigma subunit)